MKLGRRAELLTGACAFAGLGAAFVWRAATTWSDGAWDRASAVGMGLLGAATVLATLLFLRARWTPPLPGPPVGPAPDAGVGAGDR